MDRGIILLQLEICSETGQFLLACLPCCREYTGIISISPQPCFSKISSFFPLQKQGKAATSTEDLLYQPSPKHRSFQWGVSLVLHLHLLRSHQHLQHSHEIREKILLNLPWAQHNRSRVDVMEEHQAHCPSQFPRDQTLAAQPSWCSKAFFGLSTPSWWMTLSSLCRPLEAELQSLCGGLREWQIHRTEEILKLHTTLITVHIWSHLIIQGFQLLRSF